VNVAVVCVSGKKSEEKKPHDVRKQINAADAINGNGLFGAMFSSDNMQKSCWTKNTFLPRRNP
jgi:hypothetical protein